MGRTPNFWANASQSGIGSFSAPATTTSSDLQVVRVAAFEVAAEEGRRGQQDRGLASAGELADLLGVERRIVVGDADFQQQRAPQRDHVAERMEERHDAEDDVVDARDGRPARPPGRWCRCCGA